MIDDSNKCFALVGGDVGNGEGDRQGGDDSNLILLYAASHQWNTMPSLKRQCGK